MSEDKKPKIDLKARLGKTQTTSIPAAVPGPSISPAPISNVGIPAPSGVEPSSALAAVAGNKPFRAVSEPPPAMQRIELDEGTIEVATKAAWKKGLTMGILGAVATLIVGYVAGGASAGADDRAKGVKSAEELAQAVSKTKGDLENLSKKLEAGVATIRGGKFPDTLASELAAIHPDFDGTQLAGRRFSGFPQATAGKVVSFISAVDAFNGKKEQLANLLTKAQKPVTEMLANQGVSTVSYVVALGKDKDNNAVAFMAPLVTPIKPAGGKLELPAKFKFVQNRAPVEAPKAGAGALAAGSAAYVDPSSVEASFPSESAGLRKQLMGVLSGVLTDLKGEQGATAADTKAGLLKDASDLGELLAKVK